MEETLEKVTFVLVSHNSMPHIKESISSLFGSTSHPFKLIIVDSESTDGTKEYIEQLASVYSNIKIIHTKREGTVKAINVGIRNADDDNHIFLFHDDVCFFKWYLRDWLAMFLNTIKHSPDVGILLPITGGGVSGPEYINDFFWAGTWSSLIRKEVVAKLGKEMFLDEAFGNGYGDDIDMSYRCVIEGYKIARVECWIDHHGLTSHSNNDNIMVEEIKKKNAAYFRKKHNIGSD